MNSPRFHMVKAYASGQNNVGIPQRSVNPRINKYLPALSQVRPVSKFANQKECIATPTVAVRHDNNGSIQRGAASSKANTIVEFKERNSNQEAPHQNNENAVINNAYFKKFGSSEKEKLFIFTGTVERIIKWNKIFQNHFCYYEVVAAVISIQKGSTNTQKIMLLRDKKGPILQVIYYADTRIDIEDFHVEQILRCVGRMSVPNIFNALSIRSATPEEIENLQRLSLVCDHAISHFLTS